MLENSQADGCGRAGRLFNIYQARQLADTYKTFYIAVAAVSVCVSTCESISAVNRAPPARAPLARPVYIFPL